jgi:hypothetical protein
MAGGGGHDVCRSQSRPPGEIYESHKELNTTLWLQVLTVSGQRQSIQNPDRSLLSAGTYMILSTSEQLHGKLSGSQALYSWGTGLILRPPRPHIQIIRGFSESLPENGDTVPQISLQTLPSTSFPIHYLPVIQLLDATQRQTLTTLLISQ